MKGRWLPLNHSVLRRGDIGLLPYDPVGYRRRGSAVFHEVEELGIPIVAPGGAGFAADAISEGHCLGFDRFSPSSISATVLDAIARFDDLTSAATRSDRADHRERGNRDECDHPGAFAR